MPASNAGRLDPGAHWKAYPWGYSVEPDHTKRPSTGEAERQHTAQKDCAWRLGFGTAVGSRNSSPIIAIGGDRGDGDPSGAIGQPGLFPVPSEFVRKSGRMTMTAGS